MDPMLHTLFLSSVRKVDIKLQKVFLHPVNALLLILKYYQMYKQITYLTDWFIHMRNISIVLVPLVGVNFFLSLGLALIVCIWRYPRTKTPCRNYSVQGLALCTVVVSVISGW